MTNLTDNDVFDPDVLVPDNAETVIASSTNSPPAAGEGPVRNAFQQLANRTRYLLLRLTETWNGTRALKGLRLTNGGGQVVTAPAGSLVVSRTIHGAPAGAAPRTAGTEAGEVVRDNTVLARGRINPDGTILRGNGIYEVVKPNGTTGKYEVTLTRAPGSVDDLDVVVGTWESNPGAVNYSGCVWYSPTIANARITFTVEVFVGNAAADQGFSFLAYG